MKSDGSIIIDTKILDDGMNKGFEALKGEMKSVGIVAKQAGNQISMSFSKTDITKPVANAASKVRALEQQLSAVTSDLKFAIEDNDDRSAERLAAKQVKLYDRLESAREKLAIEVSSAAKKQADAEEKMAKKSAAAAQKAAAAEEKAAKKRIASATKSMRRFNSRLGSIISGALVFNIISQGLRGVTEYFGKALKSNDDFSASLSSLKGALLTAFQPIYEYVLPGLLSLMNVATRAAQAIGHIFSNLTGKSYTQMAKNAKALYEQANATEKVGEAAKEAQKHLASFDEIEKLSSSNTGSTDIGAQDSSEPDFTKFEDQDYQSKLEDAIVLTSFALVALGTILAFSGANIPLGIAMIALGAAGLYEEISTNWSAVQEELQGPVGEVVAFLSLAFLALGAILVFSGANIPLGIGLIAAGAAGLATVVVANWSSIKEALQGPVGEVAAVVGGALLVIGALLAFSGANIPLGIALIAAGAVTLATVAALNWSTIKESLQGPIGKVVAVVSGALLVLGAILAFSGVALPLGIALIALGAAGLATTAALNWSAIKEKLQGPIGKVVAIISGALLAIGAILAFSGVGLPLGIALMAAGAVGLATVSAVNWSSIKEKLQGPIGKVVAIVSGALLAIGAILAFTGVGIPLGIALMAAGAVGLVATTSANWDSIPKEIKSVIAGVLSILSGASLVLGVLLCLSGAGIPLGLALIFAGLKGTQAAWNMDDNPVTRFVKKMANGIVNIINTVIDAINKMFDIKFDGLKIAGVEVIPKFNAKLINIPKIPLLAEGAVLPPNRPFLSIVGDQRHGTNIEAPLSTIQEAVESVMASKFADMMDGFGETVAVLRDILEAVYGIHIGDDVLGQAVERYNRKLNIARGGPL